VVLNLEMCSSVNREIIPARIVFQDKLPQSELFCASRKERKKTVESSAEKFCTSSVSPKFRLIVFCTL
jgi:hypothetical protein